MTIDVEGLKARLNIVEVVGNYVALKKRGAEYVGLCPFHADTNPSFWVSPVKQFCHCFACGANNDVISFVQEIEGVDFKKACEILGAKDDWKPKAPIKQEAPLPERITSKPPADAAPPNFTLRTLGEPVVIFPIRDLDGSIWAYECRYEIEEDGKRRKEPRIWSWGARGNRAPCWGVGHLNAPRPLYGLDRIGANPGSTVLITEGPKKADAGARLLPSYASISITGGANGWYKHDYSPLRGKAVLLFPDADEPGITAFGKLAALLADPRGLACRVRVIDTRGMPEGWDIADWTGTTEELIAWAKPRASDYAPAAPEAPTTTQDAPAAEPPPEPPPEPESAPERPKKTRKPRLAVVGNTALAPDPNDDPLPAPMSEVALGQHLAEEYGKDWRHVKEWGGKWFKWEGDHWAEDRTHQIERLAVQVTCQALYWAEAATLTPKERRQISRKSTAWAARDLAAAHAPIAARADQWDADPFLLGVPGGVVDLRTGQLVDAQRELYISKCCAVAPQRGLHPLWDKVLARATGGDPTLTHFLAKWAGYMLTGDTREEAFLFVHGPGGSGKSTFVQALRDCMGDYAKAARIETFMQSKHGEHPTEIADLAGARLVSAPETEEGARWNEGRIKMLTGRDRVKARFMNRDYFEFDPVCKLMIHGNHRPRLHSVGEEMKRRLHLVEFPTTIPESERDPALKLAIEAEYPAILRWMIDGCLAWQAEGLGRPEAVDQATDDYLASQDTIGAWMDDCCTRSADARCQVGAAYRSYESWAKSRGEYVPSMTVFSEKIQGRGIAKRKASVMFFLGLALKQNDEPPPTHYPD